MRLGKRKILHKQGVSTLVYKTGLYVASCRLENCAGGDFNQIKELRPALALVLWVYEEIKSHGNT
jgi:hypothetical protein